MRVLCRSIVVAVLLVLSIEATADAQWLEFVRPNFGMGVMCNTPKEIEHWIRLRESYDPEEASARVNETTRSHVCGMMLVAFHWMERDPRALVLNGLVVHVQKLYIVGVFDPDTRAWHPTRAIQYTVVWGSGMAT